MQLRLENIGMIKEADVAIDGLTVIAGENDTGKSTVGKSLFLVLDSHTGDSRGALIETPLRYTVKYAKLIELIFNGHITNDGGKINLTDGDKSFEGEFPNNDQAPVVSGLEFDKYDVMMIETPVVWNFFKFFNAIEKIKTEASFFDQNYQIPYPYLMWDIYRKLSLPKQEEHKLKDKKSLLKQIESIINGTFTKDDLGDFVFLKENARIKKDEAKLLVSAIYRQATEVDKLILNSVQLENFEKAYKLLELNSRPQNVLAMLVMSFVGDR